MSLKQILKPTLIKIIVVVLIFLILYFYLLSSIRVSYVCSEGGEKCVEETARVVQQLALHDTLIVGIPLSIIAWIIIGLIESRKKKSESRKIIKKSKKQGKRRK